MIRFSNTLVISRPVREVFEFISNFENMPKWNYFAVSVRKITDGPTMPFLLGIPLIGPVHPPPARRQVGQIGSDRLSNDLD